MQSIAGGSRNPDRFLAGRNVVVTGGGSGIGRAIAEALGERGGHIFVTGRRMELLEQTARHLMDTGVPCVPVCCDVACEEQVGRLMAVVRDSVGGVDVLVNNAGVFRSGKLHDTSTEDFDQMFDTNVRGVFLMTKSAIPLMQGRAGANIINISSVAGTRTDAGMGVYQATKACVNSFTKVLAKELAPLGIRVNAIAPGPVDTPGFIAGLREPRAPDDVRTELSSLVPFGRIGNPKEIARLAVFLASPESDFISGSITSIDGAVGY